MGVTLLPCSSRFTFTIYPACTRWNGPANAPAGARIVNIHAGFDETSVMLKEKFPACELIVFDFYDPAKHTEVSIQDGRTKGLPAFPRHSVDQHLAYSLGGRFRGQNFRHFVGARNPA